MKGDAFALWRMPGDSTLQLLEGTAMLYGKASGLHFTMHEFWRDDRQSFDIESINQRTLIPEDLSGLTVSGLGSTTLPQRGPDKEMYCNLVMQALQAINSGEAEKLVVSRYKRLERPSDFDPVKYVTALCRAYPQAFVALVKHGAFCWICATPETLLDVAGTCGYTVALAGTRALTDATPFSDKEYAEQQFVRTHIETQLRALGIPYSHSGVEEYPAGNLKHLYTRYALEDLTPEKSDQLQEALHPTPAISGFPVAASMNFLETHESYSRTFYGGFLGPIWPNGDRRLFVNLRCMQVYDDGLVLFAGGGINEGSVPEQEWAETENKLKTLADLL